MPRDTTQRPGRPRIVIVATGGTISSRTREAGAGYTPALTGADLVAAVPDIEALAAVEVDDFAHILSQAMTPEMMFALARRVDAHLAPPEVDGVVVTHGTVTMAESAFMAGLLVASDKPVVFTGAMYPASAPDSDGPRNLRGAIRTAVSVEARGLGAVVCMGGEVHAARDVEKLHRASLAAFQSPLAGPLGVADQDRVVLSRRPARRRTFRVDRIEPEVDLIAVAAGSDDRFINASIAAGAKGIVVEGLPGRGAVPPAFFEGLKVARARGIVVALASRGLAGRVTGTGRTGWGTSGDLAAIGAVMGGDLSAPKLRILLMVLLALTRDPAAVQEMVRDVAP
ncbi:MAG: asparaginase [Armatimonadetes bacterium]|nr:asparaginase [Armatimonadota bacterium]